MNKILVLIIVCLVNLSCLRTDIKSNSDSDIKFQEFLGAEKTEALQIGIDELENWMTKKYGDNSASENYDLYLTDIIENGYVENVYHCSLATKKIIRKSGLINDFQDTILYKVIIDSINLEYYTIPKNFDTAEFIVIRNKFTLGMDLDSLINEQSTSLIFNCNGKFYKGLLKYGNEKLVEEYLPVKENGSGWVSPLVMAEELKQQWIDYNDFMIKSIVFHELCNY